MSVREGLCLVAEAGSLGAAWADIRYLSRAQG
jgi:hypothetical protein